MHDQGAVSATLTGESGASPAKPTGRYGAIWEARGRSASLFTNTNNGEALGVPDRAEAHGYRAVRHSKAMIGAR